MRPRHVRRMFLRFLFLAFASRLSFRKHSHRRGKKSGQPFFTKWYRTRSSNPNPFPFSWAGENRRVTRIRKQRASVHRFLSRPFTTRVVSNQRARRREDVEESLSTRGIRKVPDGCRNPWLVRDFFSRYIRVKATAGLIPRLFFSRGPEKRDGPFTRVR